MSHIDRRRLGPLIAGVGSRQDGFTLVEVMVVAGIMGMLALFLAQTVANQSVQTRALSEKMGSVSAKTLLTSLMATGDICLYELTSPSAKTFNASSAATAKDSVINFTQLHISPSSSSPAAFTVGSAASPDASTLIIESIQMKNFVGSGSNWVADWVLNFDNSKLVRPIKSVTLQVALTADTSSPSNAKITACNSSSTENSEITTYTYSNGDGTITRTMCHTFCALANTHDCSNCGYSVAKGSSCDTDKYTWTYSQKKGSSSIVCFDLGAAPTGLQVYSHGDGNFNEGIGCHDFCGLGSTHDCDNCSASVWQSSTCSNGKPSWQYKQQKGGSSVNCITF